MIARSSVPVVQRALGARGRLAVVDDRGPRSYRDLVDAASAFAVRLLDGREDLESARIAFMAPPGFGYVAVEWGIWLAGGVAVPLCLTHPPPELEHALRETGAERAVVYPEFVEKLQPTAHSLGVGLTPVSDADWGATGLESPPRLPTVEAQRPAMILFTSGTTSRPKGVVLSHGNLEAQITTLVKAWEWTREDRILNVLPLHHTHGVVNVLGCALWSGAVFETLARFDPQEVWNRFLTGRHTLFMAVPTIYVKLIRAWEEASAETRSGMTEAASRFRLMVSGSAALPVNVWERWKEIAGQALLERYGMTEIGMALANPYRGQRRPGRVGQPLPGVQIRLVGESGGPAEPDTPGEIQVRGANVFQGYWNRPGETADAFQDGWFRTGDVAVVEDGYYRILGRNSVDIIKSGGYKISALEIEEILRAHPAITECAVVGVLDPEWGERVCAAVECGPGSRLTLEELREWARDRIAPYKIPSRLTVLEQLPRNPMGKVTKPEVAKLFRG